MQGTRGHRGRRGCQMQRAPLRAKLSAIGRMIRVASYADDRNGIMQDDDATAHTAIRTSRARLHERRRLTRVA